jgi:hypothetical protein
LGASDSTKVQVNLKAGDALFNVYAADSQELSQGLEALTDNASNIADADALIKARFNIQPLTPAGYQTAALPAAQTAALPAGSPTAAGPAGVAPSCIHGQRTYVTGNGAKGLALRLAASTASVPT